MLKYYSSTKYQHLPISMLPCHHHTMHPPPPHYYLMICVQALLLHSVSDQTLFGFKNRDIEKR